MLVATHHATELTAVEAATEAGGRMGGGRGKGRGWDKCLSCANPPQLSEFSFPPFDLMMRFSQILVSPAPSLVPVLRISALLNELCRCLGLPMTSSSWTSSSFTTLFAIACLLLVLSFPVLYASALLEKLLCRLGLTMASSSERGAARAQRTLPPLLPPPEPEEVATFYTLVEKRVTAGALNRHARCAELSERAARHAKRRWGHNSLVMADLRVGEASSFRAMTSVSKSSSEREALWRRAWATLVPVHALLLRRLADNTLLPGTNTEDEVTYFARSQMFACKASDKPVPSEAALRGLGAVLGYTTLLDAVFHTLALLMELRGSGLPRASAHSFVLTALDAIPRTAALQKSLPSEAILVAMMKTNMKPLNFEPSFCAAVLRKWRSSAVADVLRARGVLQTGVAAHQASIAEFVARQRADIDKIGLRECALPSCDKVQRTVREFKQCSGCRSVWYCSPEHHTLDWGAHRKDWQKLDKARRAAMAAGGEASGDGR